MQLRWRLQSLSAPPPPTHASIHSPNSCNDPTTNHVDRACKRILDQLTDTGKEKELYRYISRKTDCLQYTSRAVLQPASQNMTRPNSLLSHYSLPVVPTLYSSRTNLATRLQSRRGKWPPDPGHGLHLCGSYSIRWLVLRTDHHLQKKEEFYFLIQSIHKIPKQSRFSISTSEHAWRRDKNESINTDIENRRPQVSNKFVSYFLLICFKCPAHTNTTKPPNQIFTFSMQNAFVSNSVILQSPSSSISSLVPRTCETRCSFSKKNKQQQQQQQQQQ